MKFFVFELKPDTARGETDFTKAEPVRRGDAPKCERCKRYVGSLVWLPPYRAELELWDSVFGDVSFGPGGGLLVSGRFKTLWQERSLTGLEGFDPVEIVKIRRHKRKKPDLSECPDYYRVSVRRSQAAIDARESALEQDDQEVCPSCRISIRGGVKRTQRVVLEGGTWEGEDIFIARGLPGTRLVSERFKQFMDDYKITGATLIPAESYSFDFYPHERSGES